MGDFVSYQCLVKTINDDSILKHILINYLSILIENTVIKNLC